jgi:hypothetical protein
LDTNELKFFLFFSFFFFPLDQELLEKVSFDKAMLKAKGVKVKDNPTLIKKKMKKRQKEKQKNAQKWFVVFSFGLSFWFTKSNFTFFNRKERQKEVEKQQKQRQKKREENIQKHIQKRKEKRAGKKVCVQSFKLKFVVLNNNRTFFSSSS